MSRGLVIMKDVSMRGYNTYHVGGMAKYLAVVRDEKALEDAYAMDIDKTFIGRGSKLLVGDKGYDGMVVVNKCCSIEIDGATVNVQAGANLPIVSRAFAQAGLSGMEWACGIPGSAGGAVKLNAGAFGGAISDVLVSVDVLQGGTRRTVMRDNIKMGYRSCDLDGVVVSLVLRGVPDDREAIFARMREITARRRATQPIGFSCGSVFRGADKPAAVYLEQAGLKGLEVGDAVISEKHANFIINRAFASAADVRRLIMIAKAAVYEQTGVKLSEEVIYFGDN